MKVYTYNKLYSQYKKLYHRYLKRLTVILNSYHGKNFNEDYWEPIIGLYLRRFILNYLFLDKMNRIKLLKKTKFDQINYFKNYNEFAENNDFQNINHKYSIKIKNINENRIFKFKKLNFITGKINTIKTVIPNIFVKLGITKVFFQESYFKKKLRFLFSLRTLFYINSLPNLEVETYKIDKKQIFLNRVNLIKNYINEYKEDHFLNDMIFSMPINYIENYNVIINEIKKISTVNALYVDGNEVKFDFIKFLISELKLKKKKIFVGQHSLRSGLQDYDVYFDYSKSISNYFLTWGWKNESKSIIPYSSKRIFSSIKKYKKVEDKDNIVLSFCFILSSYSKNGECLYDNFIENSKAEKARINLLKIIKRYKKFKIILKPREGSFLSDKNNFFYKKFEILKRKTRMYEIFGNYNVLIFERISLGIVESIYLNQPVIFYYPKFLYKQKSKKYNELLSLLKKANICFDDKKKCMQLLNSKKNISSWWNDKKNISNRKKLLKKFANNFEYGDLNKIKRLI